MDGQTREGSYEYLQVLILLMYVCQLNGRGSQYDTKMVLKYDERAITRRRRSRVAEGADVLIDELAEGEMLHSVGLAYEGETMYSHFYMVRIFLPH